MVCGIGFIENSNKVPIINIMLSKSFEEFQDLVLKFFPNLIS